MKKRNLIISIILTTVFLTYNLFAGDPVKKDSKISQDLIEENYLEGLHSDNQGLRISCAYFLGELKSDKAVIPLMKMLRSEDNDGARLMAALSLIKIEDNTGLFMVSREGTFNSSDRVRKMCNHLYTAYKINKAIQEVEQNVKYAALIK